MDTSPEIQNRYYYVLTGKVLFLIAVILLILACSLIPSSEKGERTESKPTSVPTEVLTEVVISPTPSEVIGDETSWIDEDIIYYDLITGLYHLYDTDVLDPLIIYTITNSGPDDLYVIIQSQVLGFSEIAVDTIEVPAGGEFQTSQTPVLNPDAIDQLMNTKKGSLRIQVSVLENGEEKKILDETVPLTVYARRDFPWRIEGLTRHEAKELLAAWVTPHDPKVEELLRYAADYVPEGVMVGGYTDDKWGVWDRLEAIWLAMDEIYDITYVSTLVSFEPGSVQRIRFPAEVLNQRSGNCIELTLLMASAAEAIRLHPYIITMPGHSIIAVDSHEDGVRAFFIETTFIGRTSFLQAKKRGGEKWREIGEMVEDPENDDYDIIDVFASRDKGVLPIPW